MVFPHNSLRSARNFAVHYGMNNIKALSEYDLAVIEPKAHHTEDIHILKNNATAVYGYLSLFEIDPQQPEFDIFQSQILRKEDISRDGECCRRYFMDLRSAAWIEYIHVKAGKMLRESGFDGIFIDTVAYIEECLYMESVMFNQLLAVCDFFKSIRSDFPGAGIILNNTLGIALNYTKELIDGVCWENPLAGTSQQKRLNRRIVSHLNEIRKKNDMRVMLLTENSADTKYFSRLAEKYNYMYYDAPSNYIGAVR